MAFPPCQLCSQPSVYYCSCQSPPVTCCHPCSYSHHGTSGNHGWSTILRVEKNIACEVCGERDAELLCCCRFPVASLCGQCRNTHIAEGSEHLEQPMGRADKIKSLGDIERARKVLENKARIEDYLDQNEAAAAGLKDEVVSVAEELIARINAAKEDSIQEIKNIEAEIDRQRTALKQEVEMYLFELEVGALSTLAREAFNTFSLFARTDVLSGESRREGLIGYRLVQLHLPQFLVASESLPPAARESQCASSDSERTEWNRLSEGGMLRSLYTQPLEVNQETVSFVHMQCREDFQVGTPEMPFTIGRHRLPLECLQGSYQWMITAEHVQALSREYSSWRRSRADGNSFYRCVGVLLCEHYCRPGTRLTEFDKVYGLMVDQTPPYRLASERQEDADKKVAWLCLLGDLLMARKREDNAFQRLQYFLQQELFDKAIAFAMRQYIVSYYRSSHALASVNEAEVREVLEDGTEADGAVSHLVAEALRVILHVFSIDRGSQQVRKTTYRPGVAGMYPSMHLLQLPGHYSYLVPRAWDAADRYDFASNTYNPTKSTVDFEENQPY